MNESPSEAVRKGLDAAQAGDFSRALDYFRVALKAAPSDAALNNLCGVALMQLGRLDEAAAALVAARAAAPNEPAIRVNLADVRARQGAAGEARAEIEAALRLNPDLADAWRLLGELAMAGGETAQAAEYFDRALQLDAGNFPLALNLARCLGLLGEIDGALHVAAHAARLAPDDPNLLALKSELLRARRDWRGLVETLEARLKQDRNNTELMRALSNAYEEACDYERAREVFEATLKDEARTAAALSEYAALCMKALKFDHAASALDEAAQIAPSDPEVMTRRAYLATYQGDMDEAARLCEACLRENPDHVQILPLLSAIRKGRLSENEEAPLKRLAAQEGADARSRATVSYILAHSKDARGDYAEAFADYARANDVAAACNKREGYVYDDAGQKAWTDHIIKTFRGAPASAPYDGPVTPIFIVGLPRCGSTLVESVLAAHSQVVAGGERAQLPPIFNNWLKAQDADAAGLVSAEDRVRIVNAYLEGAPGRDRPFCLTDKNLLNIEAVGLIAQIFPTATIVNVRRSPLEAGLAIYRQEFLKSWAFTTSLEDIGRRYGHYARLVRHWEAHYPERFFTIQYETFTDEFESEAHRLVERCKLPWEDACLDFQKAERVAATISAAQVREPVSRRSGRAKAYAPWLAPLKAALSDAGVDLESGALLT